MMDIITPGALVQRVRRVLKPQRQLLRKTRAGQARRDLGEWYVLDSNRNVVVADRVDLIALGQELEVLSASERVG
jgi:hypothetical protein